MQGSSADEQSATETDTNTDGEDDSIGTFLTREEGAPTFYGPGARAEVHFLSIIVSTSADMSLYRTLYL
jgi:hypothetical protein